jgi:hypothetical protein
MFRLFKNNSAAFSRRLGLLLVLFVFYGTTVEAGHFHGRVLPTGSNATSFVGPESSSGTLTTKSGCSDCLICQLHQNFSTTLTPFRVADVPEQPQVRLSTTAPLDVLSQITRPTSGRAPPSIS